MTRSVARHGYAADAPFIDSPRDARYHYSKRFGIESSYRLFEQAIATTTTRDPTVRLLYVVVSLLTERLAVPSLRVCGDAPPRRASPLVVAVQGVRQYDSTSCVDGPRGASGRPRESATRRPIPPLTTDRASQRVSGDAVASAADRRRQRQLSVDPSVILSSRPSVQPLRHRTQAAETASRGCFVRY